MEQQSRGGMPLSRAVRREAVRLAAPASSVDGRIPQGGGPGVSDWAPVRQVAPHTEIIVTTRGASPVHGWFVAATDSELTISNSGVTHIARTEVVEIRTLTRRGFKDVADSPLLKWGVIVGVAAGLTTGAVRLHSYCKTNTCDTAPAVTFAGYTMMGFLVGGGTGALAAVGTKVNTVIYRAQASGG